jgi:hypothetical protein
MTMHVLRGSKKEIAESLTRIDGEVREAIVFVDEPVQFPTNEPASEDVFAEMRPFMVDAVHVDDSREAIYSQMDGE